MDRLQKEKRIVKLMIEIYCKKAHKGKKLCRHCAELLQYANERVAIALLRRVKHFAPTAKSTVTKRTGENKSELLCGFQGLA